MLCSLAFLACGGSVFVTPGTGGTGGQGGEGGTGSAGGAGGQGGQGSAGGAGGQGGAGGSCNRTNDGFSYTLAPLGGGPSLDCNAMQPGTSLKKHLEGSVTAMTGPNELTIDLCPPNADCAGPIYKLAIQAPGLSMNIPMGSFIQIDVDINFPWGCSETLLVRNLPVWGGVPSSFGDVPWLMFEGSDGAPQAMDGSPFSVTATQLHCGDPEMGCGGLTPDDYRFDVAGASGVVPVYQGDTKTFDATEGTATRQFLFRNLRSFQTSWCDDYWNWAWWVTPFTPVD